MGDKFRNVVMAPIDYHAPGFRQKEQDCTRSLQIERKKHQY
jgi:hypothetical protein